MSVRLYLTSKGLEDAVSDPFNVFGTPEVTVKRELATSKSNTNTYMLDGFSGLFATPRTNTGLSFSLSDFDICIGVMPDSSDFRIYVAIVEVSFNVIGNLQILRSDTITTHNTLKYYELNLSSDMSHYSGSAFTSISSGSRFGIGFLIAGNNLIPPFDASYAIGDGVADATGGLEIVQTDPDEVYDRMKSPWLDISSVDASDFEVN